MAKIKVINSKELRSEFKKSIESSNIIFARMSVALNCGLDDIVLISK